MNADQRRLLREIALASIRHGLASGQPPQPELAALPAALVVPGACFVTLEIDGDLRGCIGSLEARRPLASDVADNAFNAAFRDPRFPPLGAAEFAQVDLHISVLSAPQPMTVHSRADLLAQLRPGIDGLVLDDGQRRATFLPSVWEQLPRVEDFVAHLLRKGGWPAQHWSGAMRAERYTTESF
jgi:AmmeMemoRadiSam system protein A